MIFVSLLARGTAAAAAVAIAFLAFGNPAHAEPPEGMVEFQDGNGSAVVSVEAGASAVFYVSDPGLATVWPGSATWTELPASVPANSWWILVTGAPHPGVFGILSDGYSTSSPVLTPLSSVPTARVNAFPWFFSAWIAGAGTFALLNDVEALSTVVVDFDFDIADLHKSDGACAGGQWIGSGRGVAFAYGGSQRQ